MRTKKGFTTFDLKIIGITLMFIDHIHQMFSIMGAPNWLDWFGRPVATLFFFVSVVGFSHTRDKKKYLSRLLIGFWIMGFGTQIVQHFFQLGDMGLQNNIFADLFIAVLAMYGVDLVKEYKKTRKVSTLLQAVACFLLPILFSVGIMWLMTFNTPLMLIPMRLVPVTLLAENSIMLYIAPVLYLLKDKRAWQCVVIAVVSILFFISNPGAAFTTNTQWMMIFSIIPIWFYNGEKGKSMKSFFYVFYPAHIWILYIIASILYNYS
ncbi:MAG: TraX family protein [Vagococcus sp.]